MRICIFGAGAVGGNFAVRLAQAGHTVSVVARGQHLAAIRSHGLTLIAGEERMKAGIAASDKAADLGPQDIVLATLKAHDLPAMAGDIGPLLGPDTAVIFAHNGIPWWYGDGLGTGRPAPPDLSMLDPGSTIRDRIGIDRTLGAVIYSSNDLAEPGVVVNNSPNRNRLLVAEPDGSESARVAALRETLEGAGISSPPVEDIRQVIWNKLIANLSVSVPAFLTEQTSREVFDDPHLSLIVERLAEEAIATAAAHGILCARDRGGPAPGHKSSMLQDYERGRPMEIAPLIDAPIAFARAAGVSIPTVDAIAALVRHKIASAGSSA